MDIISTTKGRDSRSYIFMLAVVFTAPLLPEYVAPFLTVFLAIFSLTDLAEKKIRPTVDFYSATEFVYICYSFTSAIWAENKVYTLGWSFIMLMLFTGHILLATLINTRQRLQAVIHMLLYSGVIVAAIGVFQAASVFLHLWGLNTPTFPNPLYRSLDAKVFEFLRNMFGISIKANVYTGRSNGTFSNPNIYAAFLVMIYPLAVYYLLKAHRTYKKLSYGAATVAIALGIAVSQSRGAVIALGFSTVLLIIGNRKNIRKLLVLVGGFVAGLTVVSMRMNRTEALTELKQFSGAFLGNRFDVFVNPSTYTHLRLYQAALNTVISSPRTMLFGLGTGVENVWFVFKGQFGINQPHAHNLILELWMEGGLIGTMIFLVSVLAILYDLKGIFRCSPESRYVAVAIMASFVGILTFSLTDYVFFDPKVLQIYFFLCGMASAAIRVYCKKPTVEVSE